MSKWHIEDENEPMEREADLRDWFHKERWVDVSRPKKKGKYQPCGRADTSTGKKPVCVPVNKAKNLSDKEKKNRVRQKRTKEKEPNPDKKPNVTKYTPKAGGKSNVSSTQDHNIKFSNSIINLANAWGEIRLAIMGEENEPIETDMPFSLDQLDDKAHGVTMRILHQAQAQLDYANMMLDEEEKIEKVTDPDELGNLIALLWDRAGQNDDEDVMPVLEDLSDMITNNPGEPVFNYATIKPIADKYMN